MYTLQGVSKIYPNGCTALQAIDLHLAAGERVALIGPSGAGKTTLFRMLNCTLRPSSGTLTIGGVESTRLYGKRLRHLRCRIGTIYQQHNLVPRLRVMHNVLAGHLGHWSTLLVSLHSVHLALEYFPRLIVSQQGRLVYDGPPQALSSAALQELFIDTPGDASPEAHVHAPSSVARSGRFLP